MAHQTPDGRLLTTDELRAAVIEVMRSYLGVPWQHQGRERTGIDCAGLLIKGASQLGLTQFDFRIYAEHPPKEDRSFEQMLDEHMVRIAPAEAGLADLLGFHFHKNQPTRHCAIVTQVAHGERWIIHSARDHGRVVEQRLADDHKRIISAAWRIREIASG